MMLDRRLLDQLLRRMLRRDLRNAFRRVCLVGEAPELRPGFPLVIYANHHNYYDGHLLGLLIDRFLQRELLFWMAEWDQFPFFAPVGGMPFPRDDARRRSATIRRTIRRFEEQPDYALVYFPEGRLHPAEEGVLPFDEDLFVRFGRLVPEMQWLPVALHVTWRKEARPTALIATGAPHPPGAGDARERLQNLLDTLRAPKCLNAGQTLVEGKRGAAERWNFSITAPFFKRYL